MQIIDALAPASSPRQVTQGCVLAFDFGEKRVGVAMGEHLLGIAHPLTTIDSESNDIRFASISKLIAEWQPSMFVVGLPSTQDGSEHALAALCTKFARRLNGRFGLPVTMVNESYSSAEASQSLKQINIHGRKQKPMLDAVAAQHILQSYFDRLS